MGKDEMADMVNYGADAIFEIGSNIDDEETGAVSSMAIGAEGYEFDGEDLLQKAAEKYIVPFPFRDYNEMTNPVVINGNLHFLHHLADEGLQVHDSSIIITETTVRIYRRKVDLINNPEQPSLRLKMLKYKCKTHMQICALLSQIHKHKEAVYHSNHAIKISHYLLNECKN